MLQGIHIYIKGDELAKHLYARSDHHKDRRATYVQKLTDIQKRIDELDAVLKTASAAAAAAINASTTSSMSGGTVDPAYSLRAAESSYKGSINEHGRKAAFFEFMASHIPESEVFDLSENDLTRLELLDKYLL
jgi:superoxide dismutase